MSIEEERNTKTFAMSMLSLYDGAKTGVRVDSDLSEEFEVKVGMHKGCVGCHIFFLQWW